MGLKETLLAGTVLTTPDRRENDPKFDLYLERIGRPDIKGKLTTQTPAVYWSAEMYLPDPFKIKGGGGLGVLAGDTVFMAQKTGAPKDFVTALYPFERHQGITDDLRQYTYLKEVDFEKRGFKLLTRETSDGKKVADQVTIATADDSAIKLNVYVGEKGSARIIGISEPNIGELYKSLNNSGHRLYQEVAFGFGGYKALRKLGVESPALNQINEGPAIFGVLADLDHTYGDLRGDKADRDPQKDASALKEALRIVREKTIYTNHTVVPAAEANFPIDKFEKFVIPNIENPAVKEWVRSMFIEGQAKLSTIAIELAGKRNGVSLIHAEEASKLYSDRSGRPVEFAGITNGISLERWGSPGLLELYNNAGVIDEFGLPGEGYQEKIDDIPDASLHKIKTADRQALRSALMTMKDQYGNPIEIPEDAKTLGWGRRMADYKRPDMIFTDSVGLASLLKTENMHLLLTGKAHQEDKTMENKLSEILHIIDSNPDLKERVHYIQDYREEVSAPLLKGVDIWLNTPIVLGSNGQKISTEADGTSKDKAMLNNAIVISTDDGGMADPTILEAQGKVIIPGKKAPHYLEITGRNFNQELISMYAQVRRASAIIDGQDPDTTWADFVKRQFKAYFPLSISDAKMESRYLNLAFPKPEGPFPTEAVLYEAAK